MRSALPLGLPLVCLFSVCGASLASENTNVSAQLSWSATNPGLTNLATPGELNNLYLVLQRGVTSFKGAALDLKWDPPPAIPRPAASSM